MAVCRAPALGWQRALYVSALVLGMAGQMLLIARLRERHLPSVRAAADGDATATSPAPTPMLNSTPPLLVVVVASTPRSGSSLLGELLSTSSSAVYFFEPFFYHVRNNISLSSLSDELIAGVLRQLLTCQLQRSPVMREARFRRFIWKSDGSDARLTPSTRLMERRCGASFSRVVKVVRPSLTSVLTLLHDPQLGPHVRVVHLVRDPRGVVNSQLNNTDIWPAVRRRPTAICGRLTRDLAVAGTLSDPRYTRVHYEDLALYPRETAVRLFRAIGLPQPPSLQTFLARHWNQSQPVPVDRLPLPRRDMSPRQLSRWRNYIRMKRGRTAAQAYFSTTRGSSFDPFHWQRDLRPELRRRIERDCADVLDFLRTDPSAKHVQDLRQSL